VYKVLREIKRIQRFPGHWPMRYKITKSKERFFSNRKLCRKYSFNSPLVEKKLNVRQSQSPNEPKYKISNRFINLRKVKHITRKRNIKVQSTM
jgi:hypothetical protein